MRRDNRRPLQILGIADGAAVEPDDDVLPDDAGASRAAARRHLHHKESLGDGHDPEIQLLELTHPSHGTEQACHRRHRPERQQQDAAQRVPVALKPASAWKRQPRQLAGRGRGRVHHLGWYTKIRTMVARPNARTESRIPQRGQEDSGLRRKASGERPQASDLRPQGRQASGRWPQTSGLREDRPQEDGLRPQTSGKTGFRNCRPRSSEPPPIQLFLVLSCLRPEA